MANRRALRQQALRAREGQRCLEGSDLRDVGHAQPDLRFVWLIIPAAEARKPHTYYTRLTEAQREETARRARDGEGRTVLAREYGVTRAYVHRLMNRLA